VTLRILACGLLTLSLTSELAAQVVVQDPTRPGPVQPVPDETRRQMDLLERNLRAAIDAAAAKVNNRLTEVLPKGTQFQLQFQAPPLVIGVLMPEGDAVFHVLIPGIDATALRVASMLMPTRGQRISGSGGGAPVVETAPLPSGVKPMTDPDEEYTTYARLELIDSLLDNTLQVAPDRKVIVIAGELQPQGPSPFIPRSRSLILQISGEDLIAFRTNRISRDDAKARIKESRY
jgi:hypothetical protein